MTKVIKIFSHNDLDGVGAPSILKHIFCSTGILRDSTFLETTFSSTGKYGTIDQDICNYLDSGEIQAVDEIFITDLTPQLETLQKLKEKAKCGKFNWKVIDHHKTALPMAALFPINVFVEVDYEGKLHSATSMVCRVFQGVMPDDANQYKNFAGIAEIAEMIRLYDTWDWTREDTLQAKRAGQLNNLFYFMPMSKREALIEEFIQLGVNQFFNKYVDIISVLEERESQYIDRKVSEVEHTWINGLEVAYVYAEQYTSTLGNKLAKLDKCEQMGDPVDYSIVIHGNNKVSLRTIRDDIDVSEIAKQMFGGGGHSKAAGGKFYEVQYYIEDSKDQKTRVGI